MRVRGAPPDLVVAGGILWLIAVPSFGLAAVAVMLPLANFGDCFRPDCPATRHLASPLDVIPAAIGLGSILVGLLILFEIAGRRPRFGYALFGAVGAGILLLVLAGAAVTRDPIVVVLLAGWPGWSGIAFVNAAWRARQLDRHVSEAHAPPGP